MKNLKKFEAKAVKNAEAVKGGNGFVNDATICGGGSSSQTEDNGHYFAGSVYVTD